MYFNLYNQCIEPPLINELIYFFVIVRRNTCSKLFNVSKLPNFAIFITVFFYNERKKYTNEYQSTIILGIKELWETLL